VITLPESAIQYEGEQTFVYVKNGKEFERREVKTGLSDGVNIEIKSGLSLDDVVRGPQIITTK
jgi:HlyD family secretion protein